MNSSLKIFSLLLIVIGITFSCTKETTYIEDITMYDTRVATTIADQTIVQEGVALLLSSQDFTLDQTYTISVTSAESLYYWEKELTPIASKKRVYLYFNDILMNAQMEFPSGLYTIEIFQDDLSFLTTTYQYQRQIVDEQLPSLSLNWEHEGEESFLTWEIQDGYLYDIKLYSDENKRVFHTQNRNGKVSVGLLDEDEIQKLVITANNEQSSMIDVYRIIY